MTDHENAPHAPTGSYKFLCSLEQLAVGTGLMETAEEADWQLSSGNPIALEVVQVLLNEVDARVLEAREESEFIE